MVGLFVMPYTVNPLILLALTVIGLPFIVLALRTEARRHPSRHKIARVVFAASTAVTIAYTYVVAQDGILYGCDTLWWTLECWLWA